MAIPIGTKFHGVSGNVRTKNLGSNQSNSKRDVYTFPDDFNLPSYMSYAGTMVNFGSTPVSALGGDTADFGTIKSAADDHIGFVILSVPCRVVYAGWQWASSKSITDASGTNKTITFKLSSALLGNDMNNAASWTDYLMSTSIDTDDAPYPGFNEDVSGLNIELPAGSVITMTALSSPAFDDVFEEANVSITLEPIYI